MEVKTGLTGLPPTVRLPSAITPEDDARALSEQEATPRDQAADALKALQGRAAWLAALVYRDLGALKALLERLDAKEVTILANARETTVAIGFVLDGRAWLVFRGSDDDDDWVYNLFCLPTFHIGFRLCFWGIAKKVRDWVARVAPLELPFCIVGHSLGGALATLATRRLARKKLPVEMLCTFGGPRVFSGLGACWFNSRSANLPGPEKHRLWHVTSRFVDRYELVSHTPPFFALFWHVGRRIDCADVDAMLAEARPSAQSQGDGRLADLWRAISEAPLVGPWFVAIAALCIAVARVIRAGAKAGNAHNMERYARRVDYWGRQRLAADQDDCVKPGVAGRVRFTSKLLMSTLMLMLVLTVYIVVPSLLIWGLRLLAVHLPWATLGTTLLGGLGFIVARYVWLRDAHKLPTYAPMPSVFGKPPVKQPGSPFSDM